MAQDWKNTNHEGQDEKGYPAGQGDGQSRKDKVRVVNWRMAQTFRGRQHRITRHRIWLLALILLYQVFVYPIGTALVITMENRDSTHAALTTEVLAQQRLYRQNAVSGYLGLRQPFWWIPLLIGVIAAMTEFAWLFSMVKMDFYESQPVSRSQRFRDLWCNGALLFLIPQWLMGLLAILIAAAMDGMTMAMVPDAILALAVNSIDYLAAYSVAALACTLCGNGIVAGCLTGFFLLAEPLWKVLYTLLAQSYYVTYSGTVGAMAFYFTPVTNAYVIPSRVNYYYYDQYFHILTAEKIGRILPELLPYLVANVCIAVVAALLAGWAFLRRRSEGAGASILYLPLREVVKILIAATAALGAGYIVNMVVRGDSSYQNAGPLGTFFTVLIMVIVGMITAGIIQVIYEFDLKAFFHEWWSMAFAIMLGGIVLAVFAFDLTGYNRYVPKKEDVAWGALSFTQSSAPAYGGVQNYRMNGREQASYLAENMHLTNGQLESLLEIARQGQAFLVDSTKDVVVQTEADGSTQAAVVVSVDAQHDGYFATVTYHMNSGRIVSRNIWIPDDVDSALMDSILTSRAYKDVVYPVYQDDTVMDVYADQGNLVYTNGIFQKKGKGSLYREFKEAYKKDLEQYSYSLASSELPIGYVGFMYSSSAATVSEDMVTYINSYCEVYPEYSNTLAFLKENDLYLGTVAEESDMIQSITVSNYNDDAQPEHTYETKAEIQAILDTSDNYSLAPQWYPAQKNIDFTWTVTLEIDPSAGKGLETTDEFWSSFYFHKGSVPEFVRKDVGGTQENAASS